MARFDFGGTLADFVVTSHRLGTLDTLALSAATLTMWSAQSGGTRYTDLVLNGSAVTSIAVGTDGQVPKFQGPDGVTEVWADGGAGRVRIATLQGTPGPAGPAGSASTVAGPAGPTGSSGAQGPQGLPGVNAVPADNAVAAYVAGPSSTASALSTAFVPRGAAARTTAAPVTRVARRGLTYLSAVVSNPLASTAYTNEPVGIRIEFDRAEVPTADYLTVLDENGAEVPFQWEGAINPHNPFSGTASTDPNVETDASTWPDGSLRAGTVWVIRASLPAGGSVRYSVRIHENAQGHSYTPAMTFATATNDTISVTSGLQAQFYSALGFMMRRLKDFSGALAGTEDYFDTTNGVYAQLQANGVDYFSYTAAHIQTVTHGLRNSTAFGFGVVFMDYFTQWNWVNESGWWTRVRYRVWKNGRVDIETYHWTTAALTANARKFYTTAQLSGTPTNSVDSSLTWVEYNRGAVRMLAAVTVNVSGYEATPADTLSTQYQHATNSIAVGKTSTPGTTAIPAKAYYTIRERLSTTGAYASGDSAAEWKRLRNPLLTRAARGSVADQRNQFVGHTAAIAAAYLEWVQANPTDAAPQIANAATLTLWDGYFRGVDRYSEAAAYWNTYLTYWNLDGSTAQFLDIWATSRAGFEYHGRGIQAVGHLYKDALANGRTADITKWRNQLVAYADFVIEAEKRSVGGVYSATPGTPDGSILLRGSSGSIYNAQTAALLALAMATDAAGSNATYTAAFDRIAANYGTGFGAENIISYASNYSITSSPSFHYAAFAMADAMEAAALMGRPVPTFDPREYVRQVMLPYGGLVERIATADPNRRGIQNTYPLAAACLVSRANPSESDWADANALLGFLLSRATPGWKLAPFEGPIDGWAPPTAAVSGVSIFTDIRACLGIVRRHLTV